MSHSIGIWIDHRKAVIVEVTAETHVMRVIESQVEKHAERTGDSPLKGDYEARQVPADDSRQRALTGELNRYYDSVIAALPEPASVLIFGPGEAKGEFRKRILETKPSDQALTVETDDKMTDKQIIAKVRSHFGFAAPRSTGRV